MARFKRILLKLSGESLIEQKGITSVLIGASSTAQLDRNLKCVR